MSKNPWNKPEFIWKAILLLGLLCLGLGLAWPALADYLGPDRDYTYYVWERSTCTYLATKTGGSCSLTLYYPPHSCVAAAYTAGFFNNAPTACGAGWGGTCGVDFTCSISLTGDSVGGCSQGETGCTSTEHTGTHPPAAIGGNISCSQTGNDGWCVGTASLSLSANEPVDGYSILLIEGTRNGETFACPGSACSVPLIEGQNDFTYWALSSWGDSSLMGSASGKLDSQPPQVSLSGPASFCPGCGESLSVNLTASDAASGVSSWSLALDGAPLTGGSGSTSQTVPVPSAGLTAGLHSLTLSAADIAGNVNTANLPFTLLLPTPTSTFTPVPSATPVPTQPGNPPAGQPTSQSGSSSPLVQETPARTIVPATEADTLGVEAPTSTLSGTSSIESTPLESQPIASDPSSNDLAPLFWGTAAAALIAEATASALKAREIRKKKEALEAAQAQADNLAQVSQTITYATSTSPGMSNTASQPGMAGLDNVEMQDPNWAKEQSAQQTAQKGLGKNTAKGKETGTFKKPAPANNPAPASTTTTVVQIVSGIILTLSMLGGISTTTGWPAAFYNVTPTRTTENCPRIYTVVAGDTLWGIWYAQNDPRLTVDILMSYNNLTDTTIHPGDRISIPCGSVLTEYLASHATRTPSRTPTRTSTPSRTSSRTVTPSRTATITRTLKPSDTRWPTPTPTRTRTPTRSRTPTATPTACYTSYIVQAGDTFASIAARLSSQNKTNYSGLNEAILRQANPGITEVKARRTIRIPCNYTIISYYTATPTRTSTLTRTPTFTRTYTPTRTYTRTATPTRTSTKTRTKTLTRTPTQKICKNGLCTGDVLYADEDLNVRINPGLGSTILHRLDCGNTVTVVDVNTVNLGGFTWVNVRSGRDNSLGWIALQAAYRSSPPCVEAGGGESPAYLMDNFIINGTFDITHYAVDGYSRDYNSWIHSPLNGTIISYDDCQACLEVSPDDGNTGSHTNPEYNNGYGSMVIVEYSYESLSPAQLSWLASHGVPLEEGESLYMMCAHLDPYSTYDFMESLDSFVVNAGDDIAIMGESGHSFGLHVHTEFAINEEGMIDDSTIDLWKAIAGRIEIVQGIFCKFKSKIKSIL
ncbi:MAG: LysM peptidoglycan-binding domain-containing protein [Chloroflexota bacterium]